MCLVSILTSVSFIFVTKMDYYIEAQENLLMQGLLVFFFMVVFGIGISTLYIAYIHKEPKKLGAPPKPHKDQEFILGGR